MLAMTEGQPPMQGKEEREHKDIALFVISLVAAIGVGVTAWLVGSPLLAVFATMFAVAAALVKPRFRRSSP